MFNKDLKEIKDRPSPMNNTITEIKNTLSSVQFGSVAQSCLTLCDPMNCSTPGLPVHHQLPEFTQTHVHWVSDAIQPSHPLSSPSAPAPNLSQHQSLYNESTLRMRWPKYWSFSFSIIPSKETPGLISFRMDWLDLLAEDSQESSRGSITRPRSSSGCSQAPKASSTTSISADLTT